MNNKLQQYARNELKDGLSKLPEANKHFFKRMYSPDNLDADINMVVDNMPEERLDWAMRQVQNTLDKLNRNQ